MPFRQQASCGGMLSVRGMCVQQANSCIARTTYPDSARTAQPTSPHVVAELLTWSILPSLGALSWPISCSAGDGQTT